MAETVELARAKLNLSLHVTGQRADGLHLLDSLVVFPKFGDHISAKLAEMVSLEITGPFAALLEGGDNLVTRAAALMVDGAAIQLEKKLPVAAGLGGGSADAAAVLRLLSRISGRKIPGTDQLLTLGADVPVCLNQVPVRMAGIGDELSSLPKLPNFWCVLVNAGVGVATGAVFDRMTSKDNEQMPMLPSEFAGFQALLAYLNTTRNDLQPAAIAICPVISEVLDTLTETESPFLRMSGSGGTCFGLFDTAQNAHQAVKYISHRHPSWWVQAAEI